jgi:hypothetical protein
MGSYIPGDGNFHSHRRENLKSCIAYAQFLERLKVRHQLVDFVINGRRGSNIKQVKEKANVNLLTGIN